MAFYLHLSHRSTNVIINSEQIALYSIVSTVKHDYSLIKNICNNKPTNIHKDKGIEI